MAHERKKFIEWLNETLKELGTDETVFGSYILSILEGDDDATEDDKLEALNDIFNEIVSDNDQFKEEITATILRKWQESSPDQTSIKLKTDAKTNQVPIDVEIVKLIEQTQKLKASPVQKNNQQYTEEEKRIKEQILTQYSRVEVTDEEDESGLGGTNCDYESGLDLVEKHSSAKIPPNTNVQTVLMRQKARREEARQEAAAKKQKDKEDRERQKQLIEEKKEKRKTVKGERRR